jgi:formate hydrogenlyase subunit 3/multisubunit Na+/H+ antiporter MnhD subunit
MTAVSWVILLQFALAGLAASLALLPAPRTRSVLSGIASAAMSAAGIVTGVLAMTGVTGVLQLAVAVPGVPLTFVPDRLGGLFIVLVSVIGLLVSVYGAASVRGASASRTAWFALPLFLLGMQLVPAAADAVSFLLAWEAMALGSTVLLLAEHAGSSRVSSATVWYAVMSQLSFLFLLAGFGVLSAAAGGTGFSALARLAPTSPPVLLAFVLLVLGFGSKAGLVPLHVWLPRAHPEAPSHVSAAMSAAMVKMGTYGILLVVVRFFPDGPDWWGIVLLVLGGISAVYGILQASISSDIKVLLAYSTTENVGLIVLAIGASVLLTAHGVALAAGAAMLAALLLVVSHAVFKVTLFLAAGSVLHATGERNLDHLGGLGRRMPWTAAAFGIAALGAAALPISSGFVSEWVLLQSLVHGARVGGAAVSVVVSIAMPIVVAVVALTAGLAVLTFVKAYGIGFLARPRSPAAAGAHESSPVIRAVLIVGAAGVVLLGLMPGPLATALVSVLPASDTPIVDSVGLLGVDLPGLGAILDPLVLVLLTAALTSLVIAATLRSAWRNPQRIDAFAWGGGGERAQPRMQYTATSFAEPVVRVFDDVLQPARDVEVTHAGESRYLVNRVRFSQSVLDLVESRLYRPVLTVVDRFGVLARRIQNGSIHLYLLYSFAAIIVVLVVATL